MALWYDDGLKTGFADAAVDFHETIDADHGRIETRRHWVAHDIDWLQQRHDWPGLAAIAMIERHREVGAKTTLTRHFYIASLAAPAALIAKAARNHWHIENRLHWVLDVVFHDDLSRLRTNHGPQNMAIIRQTALNLIKGAKGKMSFKTARKAAGCTTTCPWNTTSKIQCSLFSMCQWFRAALAISAAGAASEAI